MCATSVLRIQQKLSATQQNYIYTRCWWLLWRCSTFWCSEQTQTSCYHGRAEIALYKRHWSWFRPAALPTAIRMNVTTFGGAGSGSPG